MRLILLSTFFFAFLVSTAQAQEEMLHRICTEITLDCDDIVMPDLPPGMVARAVAYKPEHGKYWKNGRTLRVRFLGGNEVARSKVRKYAQEWSDVANIKFLFVEKGESDLRVGFSPGLGTWSLVGTDASDIAQHKQTMNFGWFTARTTESDYRAAILHEFGHVLGLLHEHQHPQGGIPWDKTKLYDFYQKTQGWDKALVDQQVLGRLNTGKTQYTRYDPYSIMHYPIPNSLTMGDFEVGMNNSLSATDRAFVAKVYPKKATTTSTTGTGTSTTGTTSPRPPAPSTTTNVSTVVFRDILPQNQKREQVWITVNGVTKTFVLDQSESTLGKVSFTLKDGNYAYEVRTRTTFLNRVNGRVQEQTLNGFGEGYVDVRRSATYDLAIGKTINDQWFEVKLLSKPSVGTKTP